MFLVHGQLYYHDVFTFTQIEHQEVRSESEITKTV